MRYILACFLFVLSFSAQSQQKALQGDSILLLMRHRSGDDIVKSVMQDYDLKLFYKRQYQNDATGFELDFDAQDSVNALIWFAKFEKSQNASDTFTTKPFPFQLPFNLKMYMRKEEIMQVLAKQQYDVKDNRYYLYFEQGGLQVSVFLRKDSGISTIQVLKKIR
ncbi:MAG TPA: hypothetical protein VHD35_16660 [Chitinophagaceae bacterium]|nr:hypothetical protein [Chitinophagaceae bacterium]